ncbi:thioredoxin family protein [Hymenobacter lapidiphilus]|uniref:thioredoxin family protein n=1 Tax=Hymenobacter sp. CCM 8763 TaxID=2303334 RepID=UPI000E344BBC|nr:thioredoxin fold domain-containing protein [Hymenobacter sp. CCM 8763]RFP64123.1 thioredoxin family protein [Hymenobacter sp. CCM 8763]
MKRMITLALLCLLGLVARAQTATLAFELTSWNAALEKARQTHRPIFVYAYAPGCHFCKEMENSTFQDPTATAYYNGTFVAFKVDIEADTAFARRYDIISYPTYLYLDAAGNLLYRSGGYKKAPDFVAEGRAAFDPQTAFYSLQQQYQSCSRTPDLLYRYSQALNFPSQQNPQPQVVAEYLATQSAEQLRSEQNLRYIFKYSTPQTDQYFLAHQADFTPWFSAEERQYKADRMIINQASDLGEKSNAQGLQQLRQLIKTNFADTARANSLATINFLEGRRDWVRYARSTRRYSQLPAPDTYTLSKTATYVYHFAKEQGAAQQQEAIVAALDVMPVLLKQQRNYETLLLYAKLLQQAQRQAPAKAAAQAALQQAKLQNESDEDARELLQAIDAGAKK